MIEVAGELLEALDRNETVALATVMKSGAAQARPGMKLLVRTDGSASGSLAGSRVAEAIVEDCLTLMREGEESRVARYGFDGEHGPETAVEVFLEVIRNRPTAIVVGAGHIGLHLVKIAKAVGFDVIIIDDRADFANAERLPEANQVIAGDMAETLASLKIDEHTYVVLVTRGHKHDEVTLRQVVNSPAAYVGMIGSRTRVRTVKERLIHDGFAKDRVDAVYAPIGLDIGAQTPEEIALSIVAEMVKVLRGGAAESLRDRARR